MLRSIFKVAAPVHLLAVLCLLPGGVAAAQDNVPRFGDYHVEKSFSGRSAPVVLSSKDDRMYRTMLRRAAREKPNFAGHYIVATWGCGTECVMGAVIDAQTGKVYWLPHTVCCWGPDVGDDFSPVDYRLDSRLIVFRGARNEQDGDEGQHYYKFEDGRFILIRSVLKARVTGKSPI